MPDTDPALPISAPADGAPAGPAAGPDGGESAPSAAIAANLAALSARITALCAQAGRTPQAARLIAVSKTHPAPAIAAAYAAGQRHFGENRVQEAAAKFPPLRAACPGITLHLIGPLQTNKVSDAVALFDVIQSLDRPRLADAIEREASRQARLPRLMIQVNLGEEPQKSGISWRDADSFIAASRSRFGDAVVGLMGIAPLGEDPAPYFERLAALRAAHGLPELSLGMSGDYPAAIAAGATWLRIGSAIFGLRG